MQKAFFRVRLFFAVAIGAVAHQAGAILHLMADEASAHGHKLEPLTDDEAAAAGVTPATAANVVAAVAALPANDVVVGLQLGDIHIDTARAAFPDAFAAPAVDPIPAESAPAPTAEAAAVQAPAAAETAPPAAPDATSQVANDAPPAA